MDGSIERYELSFEDFDFRVSVDGDGEASISFHESGKCAFSCSWNDLSECLSFARTHIEVEA